VSKFVLPTSQTTRSTKLTYAPKGTRTAVSNLHPLTLLFANSNQTQMHPASQICPVRLCDQMKMVAHQNKTQNRRLKSLRRFAQQLQKANAIALVMKNCLAGIASCAEMIDGIFKLHPQRTRHSSRVGGATANVKCLDLTPFSFLLPFSFSRWLASRDAVAGLDAALGGAWLWAGAAVRIRSSAQADLHSLEYQIASPSTWASRLPIPASRSCLLGYPANPAHPPPFAVSSTCRAQRH